MRFVQLLYRDCSDSLHVSYILYHIKLRKKLTNWCIVVPLASSLSVSQFGQFLDNCDCGHSLGVSYIPAVFRLKVHQLQHVTGCEIPHRNPRRRIVQILVSSSSFLALRRFVGFAIVAIPSVFLSFLCSLD